MFSTILIFGFGRKKENDFINNAFQFSFISIMKTVRKMHVLGKMCCFQKIENEKMVTLLKGPRLMGLKK
jgi:hypothetical protein